MLRIAPAWLAFVSGVLLASSTFAQANKDGEKVWTPEEILQTRNADKAAWDQKYRNQVMRVRGEIVRLRGFPLGEVEIRCPAGLKVVPIWVNVSILKLPDEGFHHFQQITMEGRALFLSDDELYLRECKIAELPDYKRPEKTPAGAVAFTVAEAFKALGKSDEGDKKFMQQYGQEGDKPATVFIMTGKVAALEVPENKRLPAKVLLSAGKDKPLVTCELLNRAIAEKYKVGDEATLAGQFRYAYGSGGMMSLEGCTEY